jgi:hypothetical protein
MLSRCREGVSSKDGTPVFYLGLSPLLCFLAGTAYHPFNRHYVLKWWVRCKYCEIGERPGFDANDFTLIFFGAVCLLATLPVFFMLTRYRWRLTLGALAINAFICRSFLPQNIWL